MKALSVRSPWWWFILFGGKDVENRDWWTSYRGPLLIQASKWWRRDQVAADLEWATATMALTGVRARVDVPRFAHYRDFGGMIVGKVDLVDCARASPSAWYAGEWAWVLRNPVAFEDPVPWKGRLGLFDVALDVEG